MGKQDGADGWMPQATTLRSFFDELQRALAAHSPLAKHFVPLNEVSEYDRIWTSVSLLVNEVEKHGDGSRSFSAFQYESDDQAAALSGTLADLRSAIRSRVLDKLGEKKVAAALELLTSPMPDLMRIFGREEDENTHSQFIAWLLDHRKAPNVARYSLRALCAFLPECERWRTSLAEAISGDCISVRREYVVAWELYGADELARIDIVVTAPGLVLAIENKVRSSEHSDQTKTYWKWLERTTGLHAGLFLSPGGGAATCPDFTPMTYFDLLGVLLEAPTQTKLTETEVLMLSSYVKTLLRTIIPVEGRALRSLGEKT